MSFALAHRALSIIRKPPGYVLRRLMDEVSQQADRWRAPARDRRLDLARVLAELGSKSTDALWDELLRRPYPFPTLAVDRRAYDSLTMSDSERILAAAEAAMRRQVEFLGSGSVQLGQEIDWHTDFKTGTRFPPKYFRDIDYARLGEPCDVKVPWELSRLQWLIPAGQAYLLTGDERYAAGCREVLEQWMQANPYACSVNWACTMEAALRILSWTWLFRAMGHSRSWRDSKFRGSFIRSLYLHADFTERYIERSDVNGNHFIADAAALVIAGSFFGDTPGPLRWREMGWRALREEIQRQVHPDGVDFEASVPYHRLVQELFLLPVLYRRALGEDVDAHYVERLQRMASFSADYTRPDGRSPVWGDNDDARALPFGRLPGTDHRYLVAIAAQVLGSVHPLKVGANGAAEVFWVLGADALRRVQAVDEEVLPRPSAAYRNGGLYIMRNASDHVFISSGPVGLAGRGGHSHNDMLAIDACLASVHLLVDSGCYIYTASVADRNRFRSTAYHSTPQVDGEEINRFIRPDFLWSLRSDAHVIVRDWKTTNESDEFCGSHDAYARLRDPVDVTRRVALDHRDHSLTVEDTLEGQGAHSIRVPYHLAENTRVVRVEDRIIAIDVGGVSFEIRWDSESRWAVSIEDGMVAPSYGIMRRRPVVVFSINGSVPQRLTVRLRPL